MKTVIALSCLILVLAACNSTTPTPLATTVLSPAPVIQPSVASAEVTPVVTVQRPRPTSTPAQIRTPTMKSTTTSTSVPTSMFSQAEADQGLIDLLITNGGCQLPCWWGLNPGKSTWQDAWNLLSRYDSNIYVKGTPEQERFMEAYIPVPEISGKATSRFRTLITANKEIIQTIDVHGVSRIPSYSLANFLSQYGQPDEIWISTYQFYPSVDVPFTMVLFYRRGILAGYSTLAEDPQGDVVLGCLQDTPQLRLWDPVKETTFQESAALFGWNVSGGTYLSLEQASDLSVEKFYQIYQGSNKVPCVKTPAKLWP
jgi:hypothetical protein